MTIWAKGIEVNMPRPLKDCVWSTVRIRSKSASLVGHISDRLSVLSVWAQPYPQATPIVVFRIWGWSYSGFSLNSKVSKFGINFYARASAFPTQLLLKFLTQDYLVLLEMENYNWCPGQKFEFWEPCRNLGAWIFRENWNLKIRNHGSTPSHTKGM